jgi:tetratricopeptide (TPR) repeat protein
MNMQLKNTLTIISTCLFLISFNATSAEVSAEIKACNDAVNEGNAKAALVQSEAILKTNATDYEGLLCKGRALSLQGNYVEALAAMELAANSTEDLFAKTVSYILIGNLHKTNNKVEEAVASYKKSIELSEKKANKTYTRMNYNLIGDTYFDAKDNNAALDHYLISMSLANNDNERAESFENLAKTYHTLGNHDKAIEFQLKATVMQKQAGSLTAYADSTLLLGQYFLDAKEYSHAERNYQKLAQFAKDNGGAYYEAKANYGLAEAMFANGDKAGAKTLFIEAAQLAKKIGANQLAAEIEAAQKKLNI